MYCLLNTKGQVPTEDVPDLAKNLNAEPCKNHNFSGKLGNLKTFVKPSGEYYIKGSIWKYGKGNNAGSYSIQEFFNTVDDLNSLTFGTYSQSKVIGYEFGFNINTNYNPSHYLISMLASKHNKRMVILNPEYKKNEIWMRRSGERNRGFKCYNKTLESRMGSNLLRFEYFVINTNKAFGRSLSLEDLISPDFISSQYEVVRSFARNLVFQSDYNPGLLAMMKPQDKWRYLGYARSGIKNPRALLKSMDFDTVARSREYKHLMRIIPKSEDTDQLKSELCEKVDREIRSVLL